MTVNAFITACEKAGCNVDDGTVMFGDIELGTYGVDWFDVMADTANESRRHIKRGHSYAVPLWRHRKAHLPNKKI